MTAPQLIEKSNELSEIKSSEEVLFKRLNSLKKEKLQKLNEEWKPDKAFQPVIFLRFLISYFLLQEETITKERLEALKDAIEQRDISDIYEPSHRLAESLRRYKESPKGMFPQWKEPFIILHPFFYTQEEKNNTIDALKRLGHEVIERYGINGAKVHAVGFDGPQNYGTDLAWCAIIPDKAVNAQYAYQLFLRVDSNGYESALYKGHKVKKNDFEIIKTTFRTWDECINSYADLLPKWSKLNNELDFPLHKHEQGFIKRIKSNSSENLSAFFGILDKLIHDLSITDDDKLVFSIASNQFSFHIGRRYCLVLKKNEFSFITTQDYKVEGLEPSPFSGEPYAMYYKGANSKEVLEHYNAIIQAVQIELDRETHVYEKDYDNLAFRRATFDKEYRSTFFDFTEPVLTDTETIEPPKDQVNGSPLNQILFGPPGTGKTYSTIEEAINIIDPEFYRENISDREKLRERYETLLIKDWDNTEGQIAFTTFHQSFSYEDFVEGIRPISNGDHIKYEVEPGIFKKICDLAVSNHSSQKVVKEGKLSWSKDKFEAANFWKLSLGDSQKKEDVGIYHYCKEKSVIALGFSRGESFEDLSRQQIIDKCKELGYNGIEAQQLNYFIHDLQEGDYVFIGNGNKMIRAFGKVNGPYEHKTSTEIEYEHFRKVEWLFVDEKIPVEKVFDRPFSQKTMYQMEKSGVNSEFFTQKRNSKNFIADEAKKFVLIVDEINRGNVSGIFGELISLIEKDKRSGEKEELEVTLPYSKAPFTVPSNVYLIGTMNTADRSVEALDTALRRRFSFREIKPQPDLLSQKLKDGPELNMMELLATINSRIEKLIDKDHKIGHAYLMGVTSIADLKDVFNEKVIPLLEEYFFGDFGKIGLVLGSSFVEKERSDEFSFAEFKDYDVQYQIDLSSKPVFKIKDSTQWDFKSIYEAKLKASLS